MMIEQFPKMAFNLLKKVTVWLINGKEKALLKEGESKERDVCNVLVIILFFFNLEEIKTMNIKAKVFNYM